MRELLLPHVQIITPNSIEARHLVSDEPDEQEDLPLDIAAARLIECGCQYVLITGTHENTLQVVNTLYTERAARAVIAVLVCLAAYRQFRLHAGISDRRHDRKRLHCP